LSMLALPGDWAANMTADLLQSEMQAQIQGRDLNSLLTVARVSENTLRVRLGAMQQATADFAMVPRSHNITLIVMVPKGGPPVVQVAAKTSLVDTESGEELIATTDEVVAALFDEIRGLHSLPRVGDEVLEELLALARDNDQEGFFDRAARLEEAMAPLTIHEHSLWIDMVSLMIGSQFSTAWFELPGHGVGDELSQAFCDQTVLLVDNGLDPATATIRGARFSGSVELGATLHLSTLGREIALPAASIELDTVNEEILLSFPSLLDLGLLDGDSMGTGMIISLEWATEITEFDAMYVPRRAAADQ